MFFSGMPSDAAGPVADSVTPTLMSAHAGATMMTRGKRRQQFADVHGISSVPR